MFCLFSLTGIDYAGALGIGAFLASTSYLILYFLILLVKSRVIACYCPSSGERREITPDVGKTPFTVLFLPVVLAGGLCAIGQACWLVANEALQAAITFPIAATLPGALATLLGTVLYREVQVSLTLVHQAVEIVSGVI